MIQNPFMIDLVEIILSCGTVLDKRLSYILYIYLRLPLSNYILFYKVGWYNRSELLFLTS